MSHEPLDQPEQAYKVVVWATGRVGRKAAHRGTQACQTGDLPVPKRVALIPANRLV
jgi:hypothetical protein